MRVLHAWNADGRAGPVEAIADAGPRTNPRAPFGQLLPLYGLSGDRRRDRKHCTGTIRTIGMTQESEKHGTMSVLDRPNSYIGKTVPRPNLDRLLQGRGLYVSDIELPRMGHAVFL